MSCQDNAQQYNDKRAKQKIQIQQAIQVYQTADPNTQSNISTRFEEERRKRKENKEKKNLLYHRLLMPHHKIPQPNPVEACVFVRVSVFAS